MHVAAPGPASRYARVELERRFLAARLPPRLGDADGWRILDRYIAGTRLRLRRAEPLRGGEPVFKLGQKQAVSPPDPTRVTITNIYLSADEHAVFASLPANELRKRRHRVRDAGRSWSVDVFEGRLAGLVLAESELAGDEEARSPWQLPAWIAREVTDDRRLTGGALAALDGTGAAALLDELARDGTASVP